jgi:biopolymer transport protein ExbD
MSRRSRYQPNRAKNTFALNITSMTDMFTILLVFLLQSYSTAEIQVTPDKGQELPVSSSESNNVPAVQVSLTKEELRIDDRVIASLKDFNFNSGDIDSNDTNFVVPLFKELQKTFANEKAKQDQYDKDVANGTLPIVKDQFGHDIPAPKPNQGILEGRIIVKADQNFSYGVLRKVMYTASMAGFPKMKMATVVGR